MSLDAKVAAVVEGGDVRGVATEAFPPEVLGYLRAVVRDEVDASDIFSQFAEDLWKCSFAPPAPSGRSLPATRSEIGGAS